MMPWILVIFMSGGLTTIENIRTFAECQRVAENIERQLSPVAFKWACVSPERFIELERK